MCSWPKIALPVSPTTRLQQQCEACLVDNLAGCNLAGCNLAAPHGVFSFCKTMNEFHIKI